MWKEFIEFFPGILGNIGASTRCVPTTWNSCVFSHKGGVAWKELPNSFHFDPNRGIEDLGFEHWSLNLDHSVFRFPLLHPAEPLNYRTQDVVVNRYYVHTVLFASANRELRPKNGNIARLRRRGRQKSSPRTGPGELDTWYSAHLRRSVHVRSFSRSRVGARNSTPHAPREGKDHAERDRYYGWVLCGGVMGLVK